jgi:hypothetical protein
MNLIFRVMTLVMAMFAYAVQPANAQPIATLADGSYTYCSLPKPTANLPVATETSPPAPPAIDSAEPAIPAWIPAILEAQATSVGSIGTGAIAIDSSVPGTPPAIPIQVLPASTTPVLTKSTGDLNSSVLQYLSQSNAVCFEFQKQGQQVRGILNSPAAHGTDGIHLIGTTVESRIIGQAVQVFVDGATQVRSNPNPPIQNVQDYWNNKVFINLKQPQFLDATVPAAVYQEAIVNLSNFYPY